LMLPWSRARASPHPPPPPPPLALCHVSVPVPQPLTPPPLALLPCPFPVQVKEDVLPFCIYNGASNMFGMPKRKVLHGFRVVVATCSAAGLLREVGADRVASFSHVLIDEAGQVCVRVGWGGVGWGCGVGWGVGGRCIFCGEMCQGGEMCP
jgi:hypothetical protein